MQDENKKVKLIKEILGNVLFLAIVVGGTFLLITYVGQRTKVSGRSMEPTLNDGDNLIADKITYRFRNPERFDIIVFPVENGSEDAQNSYYIKRIIGMPGETVYIDEAGVIYIDGEVLTEGYGKEVIASTHRGLAESEITLSEDEYFVLGDNRNNSEDSRSPIVGNIKRERIVGRAWLRFWPLQNFGILKHQ